MGGGLFVSARGIDSRIEVLDQSLSRHFAAVNERLDLVERRIARLEERVAGLVQGHTRARTSDIDRIAALEARVAELEAKLAARGAASKCERVAQATCPSHRVQGLLGVARRCEARITRGEWLGARNV